MTQKRIPITTAMIKGKCPRCRKGNMFKHVVSAITNKTCGYCGFAFERHPGYFYTAMYASYAMFVAEGITLGVGTAVLSGGSENTWLYLGVIIPASIILAPFNLRYSKVIQMYWLDPQIKYDPNLLEVKQKGLE